MKKIKNLFGKGDNDKKEKNTKSSLKGPPRSYSVIDDNPVSIVYGNKIVVGNIDSPIKKLPLKSNPLDNKESNNKIENQYIQNKASQSFSMSETPNSSRSFSNNKIDLLDLTGNSINNYFDTKDNLERKSVKISKNINNFEQDLSKSQNLTQKTSIPKNTLTVKFPTKRNSVLADDLDKSLIRRKTIAIEAKRLEEGTDSKINSFISSFFFLF